MNNLNYEAKIDPRTGAFELAPSAAQLLALCAIPSRQAIETLESHMVGFPQVEIPVQHRFAQGMYVREITIPKDTLMTGKVHLFEHVSIMLSGDMTVLTETGMQRITGHNVFVSPPGTKRVGYAHEETKWLTVHATDETDVAVLEATLVEPWALEQARVTGETTCLLLQQQS